MTLRLELIFRLSKLCYELSNRKITDEEREDIERLVNAMNPDELFVATTTANEYEKELPEIRYKRKLKRVGDPFTFTADKINLEKIMNTDSPDLLSVLNLQLWLWLHDDYRKALEINPESSVKDN